MSQKPNRAIVIRVRGLPGNTSAALQLLDLTIGNPSKAYKATIIPSCDRPDESIALLDFKEQLPESLKALEQDRLAPYQIPLEDDDLLFDQNFHGFTQLFLPKNPIQAELVFPTKCTTTNSSVLLQSAALMVMPTDHGRVVVLLDVCGFEIS